MAIKKTVVDYEGKHTVLQGDDKLDVADISLSASTGNQLVVQGDDLGVFGYYDAVSGKEATVDGNPGNPLSTGYIEFKKGDGVERVNTLTTDFINFRVTGRRISATIRKLLGKVVAEQYTLQADLPVPTVLNLNVSDGVRRKLLWCSYKRTWEYWLTGTFQAQTVITLPSSGGYTFGSDPVMVTASPELGSVTVSDKSANSLKLTVQNPGVGTVKLEGWY